MIESNSAVSFGKLSNTLMNGRQSIRNQLNKFIVEKYQQPTRIIDDINDNEGKFDGQVEFNLWDEQNETPKEMSPLQIYSQGVNSVHKKTFTQTTFNQQTS